MPRKRRRYIGVDDGISDVVNFNYDTEGNLRDTEGKSLNSYPKQSRDGIEESNNRLDTTTNNLIEKFKRKKSTMIQNVSHRHNDNNNSPTTTNDVEKSFKSYDGSFKEPGSKENNINSNTSKSDFQSNDSIMQNHNVKKRIDIFQKHQKFRRTLPIYSARDKILDAIQKNQVIVLIGETGSGKTTQVPQYIFERFCVGNDNRGIAVTQPRKLTTKTTARRVSEEMGSALGEKVGYHVRFEKNVTNKTRITFLTDGMFLRECMVDPELKKYNYIILDEAHERTIHTDVACGLVKQILKSRSDLKVVIMSATLEADLFASYFDNAPVLYVQGRQFPVQIFYVINPVSNWIEALIITVFQIHLEEDSENADILAFMTGHEEIEHTAKSIREKSKYLPPNAAKLIVCPLYAAQSSDQQDEIFEPTPKHCRKVVLATNIAETSITVPGIKFVIDSGLVKQKQCVENSFFDQDLKSSECENSADNKCNNRLKGKSFSPLVDILHVVPESKAQSWQRAGRAGRTQPGKVYRLFTESYFLEKMPDVQLAEIKRVDLTSLILQLFVIGIKDPVHFPYLESPSKKALTCAIMTLLKQGALDKSGKLTPLGEKMAIFPLDPRYSKVLIKSKDFECTHQVMTIIAMLVVENIFYIDPSNHESQQDFEKIGKLFHSALENAKKSFSSTYGDHIFLLNVYYAYILENQCTRKAWAKSHCINWRSMKKVLDIKEQLIEYWKATKWYLGEENNYNIRVLFSDPQEWQSICERICKSFISGFFENIALRNQNGSYQTLKEQKTVFIHPSSVMFNSKPDCILYDKILFTTKHYIRSILPIERFWLDEVAPENILN